METSPGINWDSILRLLSLLGIVYFGLTILILTFVDTEFNPITQAASDYGIGSYAVAMNVGFLVAGIGFIAFVLAMNHGGKAKISRTSSILLFVASFPLILNSYFTTNLEGAPATLHGTIHGFGGFVFFVTAPLGILLVSRKFGRRRLLTTAVGLLVGYAVLFANIDAFGLGERLVLLVIFSSIIIDIIQLDRLG